MLVLTRKVGSSIIIGDDIKIQIVQINGRQVRLGIEAPKDTKVHREEVHRTIGAEKRELEASSSDHISI